jgi:hypothetical protein
VPIVEHQRSINRGSARRRGRCLPQEAPTVAWSGFVSCSGLRSMAVVAVGHAWHDEAFHSVSPFMSVFVRPSSRRSRISGCHRVHWMPFSWILLEGRPTPRPPGEPPHELHRLHPTIVRLTVDWNVKGFCGVTVRVLARVGIRQSAESSGVALRPSHGIRPGPRSQPENAHHRPSLPSPRHPQAADPAADGCQDERWSRDEL